MQFYSNGETQPLVLREVFAKIRAFLISNQADPNLMNDCSMSFNILFKYPTPKSDPELIQIFKQSMLNYLNTVQDPMKVINTCKVFSFCSPAILAPEDPLNAKILDKYTAVVEKSIDQWLQGVNAAGKNIDPTDLAVTMPLLRILISAAHTSIIGRLSPEKLLRLAVKVGETLPKDGKTALFPNGMFTNLLYIFKSMKTL